MSCSIKYSQDTALKIRSPALELGTKTRKAYLDVFSNQIKKNVNSKISIFDCFFPLSHRTFQIFKKILRF